MAHNSTPNLKARLVDGLLGWLTFEFACERGYLFSEYYLAHAVGQLLRAAGPHVYAEVPHPSLAKEGATGRPASIDFVVYDAARAPTFAVETKWAGFSDVTAGTLAWDAFRLEAFSRIEGKPGLLVLAGTRKRVNALLSSHAFQRRDNGRPALPMLPLPKVKHRLVLARSELSLVASRYVEQRVASAPAGAISDRLSCEIPCVGEHSGPNAISFVVYVWAIRSSNTPATPSSSTSPTPAPA